MDQEFNMYVWEFTTYKNYWRYNFSGFCLIMPADFVKRLEAYAARLSSMFSTARFYRGGAIMWYEKKRTFCATSPDSFSSGVGILDPTTHDYCDAYADGYLKVVDWYCSGGVEYTSRVCWCKVYWNKDDKPYFRHNGRRYWLDEFMRCTVC